MKKSIVLVAVAAALLCLGDTAEARGFRGRGCNSGCGNGGGIFQRQNSNCGTCGHSHGVVGHGNFCDANGCVLSSAPLISSPTGGIVHQTIPYGSQPQQTVTQQPILVRGQDGRMYYLVPQEQFKQPQQQP